MLENHTVLNGLMELTYSEGSDSHGDDLSLLQSAGAQAMNRVAKNIGLLIRNGKTENRHW